MTVVLALTVGVLFTTGVYLLLERSLTRIIVGLGLLGHGANLLVLASGGRAGEVPIVGGDGRMADPLPQALILTAIVISFGVTVFLLALARSSWLQRHDDHVDDDPTDRRLADRYRPDRSGGHAEEGAASSGGPAEEGPR